MEIASQVSTGLCSLYDRSKKYTTAISNLRNNLAVLREKKDELLSHLHDVQREIEAQERQGLVRTDVVTTCINQVEKHIKETESVLARETQVLQNNCCWGRCYKNFRSRYNLAKVVEEKRLALVVDLGGMPPLTQVTYQPAQPLVREIPMEVPLGLEPELQQVWGWIQDDSVHTIGIFGMGRIGKTTLLHKIHNKLTDVAVETNCDLVVWVVISQTGGPEKIQHILWQNLKLPADEFGCSSMDVRASRIFDIMKRKTYLLFLDDVWDTINLTEVGIPRQARSTVVISSRFEDVCFGMQAERRLRMKPLPRDKSVELFRRMVGEETLSAHEMIPQLAESIVEVLEGYPLAINVVARAMSSRLTPGEWIHAIDELKRRPSDFPGLDRQVFPSLKFSYDCLTEVGKKCFAYCSVLPEDHAMGLDELANMWIGQGFFDDHDDMLKAKRYARNMVVTLKRACLLEGTDSEIACMHDILRELALWISREEGARNDKVIVHGWLEVLDFARDKKWTEAETISLWAFHKVRIENSLSSSNLTTLIFRHVHTTEYPDGFFGSLPSLKVLNLEDSGIKKLSNDIGEAVNLEYLNIINTRITELPMELKKLVKLKYFYIGLRCHVPVQVISGLLALRVFGCGGFATSDKVEQVEEVMIQHFEGLSMISEIQLLVRGKNVNGLLANRKLHGCLTRLFVNIQPNSAEISLASMRDMENLEQIDFDGTKLVEGEIGSVPRLYLFPHLTEIRLKMVEGLQDVSCLINNAPMLKVLSIVRCTSLEEVVKDDAMSGKICITRLRLVELPNLKRICRGALPFPLLKDLFIDYCPLLTRLPFKHDDNNRSVIQNAPLLKNLTSYENWWDALEWDEQVSKDAFVSQVHCLIMESNLSVQSYKASVSKFSRP